MTRSPRPLAAAALRSSYSDDAREVAAELLRRGEVDRIQGADLGREQGAGSSEDPVVDPVVEARPRRCGSRVLEPAPVVAKGEVDARLRRKLAGMSADLAAV